MQISFIFYCIPLATLAITLQRDIKIIIKLSTQMTILLYYNFLAFPSHPIPTTTTTTHAHSVDNSYAAGLRKRWTRHFLIGSSGCNTTKKTLMRITKHPANLIIRKTQQTSYNHKHTFSGRRIIVSIKRSPRKEWWPVSKRMPCVWYSDFDSQESNSSVTKQLRRGYETEPKSS